MRELYPGGCENYTNWVRIASMHGSNEGVQLGAVVRIVTLVFKAGVARHQRVLAPDVQVVVDLPVDLTHLARRVPQALRQEPKPSIFAHATSRVIGRCSHPIHKNCVCKESGAPQGHMRCSLLVENSN